jgi:hypothetical protein
MRFGQGDDTRLTKKFWRRTALGKSLAQPNMQRTAGIVQIRRLSLHARLPGREGLESSLFIRSIAFTLALSDLYRRVQFSNPSLRNV